MGSHGSTPALLWFVLSCLSCSSGWRSECDVQGLDVKVFLREPAPVDSADVEGVRKCQVSFLTHEDLETPNLDFSGTDFIFTDSLAQARFAGRSGLVHFLENVSAFHVPDDLDAVMQQKTELLSILLPPPEHWTELTQQIYSQAQTLMPEHIFFDDGSLETHAAAFTKYRFSLIADDGGNRTVSQAMVRSLGFHAIPMYNGFVEIGAMAFNGVADFAYLPTFNLVETLETCKKHNEHAGALWHYHRILQDQLQYRYNRPFEERLLSQACTVCRSRAPANTGDLDGMLGAEPKLKQVPLVYVGIYSARANFKKRQMIRETWGRVLRETYGFRYTFFLGLSPTGSTATELLVKKELEEHDDIVFLGVDEGYRMNSRKGLLFLEWIAQRSEAEFLLKIDDDVYFRPAPLLEQLRHKPPAAYIWGYWDYMSPVPREEGDHFFNTWESYPFDTFAPYPRGVVRVLSMDLVRLVGKAGSEGRLKMIFGDDPCIGYHLRQLVFDEKEPLPSVTLDDFDNKVFAMEPSCHPNLWSRMNNRTWAVHHVTPDQIQCMWNADVQAGLYQVGPAGLSYDSSWPLMELPDLCGCAPDPKFESRTDLDDLRAETNSILFED